MTSTKTRPDPAWLDSMYNNRSLVPDYATYFDNWAIASKAARRSQLCALDVAYGKTGGEKLDIFTGAVKDKKGWLEEANNGTIFLDEVGEMNIDLQAKLLGF